MNKTLLFIKTVLIIFLFIAQSQASYISLPTNSELPPFNDILNNAPFEQVVNSQVVKSSLKPKHSMIVKDSTERDKNTIEKSTLFASTTTPNDIGIVALLLFVIFMSLIRKSKNLI